MAEHTVDYPTPDFCHLTCLLNLIGGKWRLPIILVLGEETLRYHQLTERLPGISEKMLSGELKALVARGVLERTVFAEVPVRVEYRLSSRGLMALPVLSRLPEIGKLFIDN